MSRPRPHDDIMHAPLWPTGLQSMRQEDAGSRINRHHSPTVVQSVLEPLERKMQQYDELLQESYQQTADLEEKIRLVEQQKARAEAQFLDARAKRGEYERQREAVTMALHGGPDISARQRYTPVYEARESEEEESMLERDSFADEKRVIRTSTQVQPKHTHLEPSYGWTAHQVFYVFGMHGIGSMIISGGINFALAYAMYTTQDTVKNPIRLFELPNTLLGDAAVTIIIQCIITWFIEKGMVAMDLSHRGVQPVGFISMPSRPWLRWLLFLPPLGYDEAMGGDGMHEPLVQPKPRGVGPLIVSIVQDALRGFLIAVIGILLLWPISAGALMAFGKRSGGDYTYAKRWVPQAFKGILGGVLGLLSTPFMALFWLVKTGWEADLYLDWEP